MSELEQPAEHEDFSHLDAMSSPDEIIEYGRFLSRHHALSDGTPVPPTTKHILRGSAEGIGPTICTIEKVLGSVACLQKEVGFVMPTELRHWTEDDYIENGKWLSEILGEPDCPVALMWDTLTKVSKLHIGPSPLRVAKEFGSIDAYNDRLGFVTPATLKRWTEDDWKANARWLSELVGSAEEPAFVNQEILRAASNVKIAPSPEEARQRYGSMAEYQRAMGYEVRQLLPGYEDWGRETYIENGRWLSHLLGSPDQPKMPVASDIIEASALGLCPPLTAIEKRFGRSLLKYQDALGFVTRTTLARWSEQDWIDNGLWFTKLISEDPARPMTPRQIDFEQGSALNITPSVPSIVDRFGSFLAFQEKMGFVSHNANRHLSKRDAARAALKVSRSLGGRPRAVDYKDTSGVSLSVLQTRFGSLTALHEMLGFPAFETWSEEKMIRFGLFAALNNGGELPNSSWFDKQSNKDKSFPYRRIHYKFGSFGTYKSMVDEVYPRFAQLHQQLKECLPEPQGLAEHLLQDFQDELSFTANTEQIAQQLQEMAEEGVSLVDLHTMFRGSRLVVLWEEDDFMYFARRAFKGIGDDVKERWQRLEILDRANLCPYMWEIEEVFGSIEAFLEQSIKK